MRFTSDIRKRLGRKRAGRVGVCVLERWIPVSIERLLPTG